MTNRVGVLLLQTVLVVLAAPVSVIAPAPASASQQNASGDVTAQRFGTQTATLSFVAGGNQKGATGQFTYTELGTGYSVTANVTCYYQENVGPKPTANGPKPVARRAVFTGPVIAENPDHGTQGMVVWVADNHPSPSGVKDFFDVGGGASTGPNCAQDFPLNRFDNPQVLANVWYVTSGDIVIG
jgi:hypothetical protein